MSFRCNLTTARSSADRNREISWRLSGGGPRVVAPALRKSVSKSRVAKASGKFDAKMLGEVEKFMNDPAGWSKAHGGVATAAE